VTVGIIGPGHAGLGLAVALTEAGYDVRLYGRRAMPVPAGLRLVVGPDTRAPQGLEEADVIVCAVRDDAVRNIAAVLAAERVIESRHTVLHLSACWGRELLDALSGTGAALGSLHFLQTIVDPASASAHLRGARAAVEGDPRAVRVASEVARSLGLVPLVIPSAQRPIYHAAAVVASNYIVVLAAVAQRLAVAAGIPEHEAWAALRPLVRGSMQNLLAAEDPADALTGPAMRGDDRTITEHLRHISGMDREIYRVLGRAALDVAARHGVTDDVLDRARSALADDADPVGE
jgi:predicted short-subunit dehydrogenase-like oxidoreductase (DUF2520 family)